MESVAPVASVDPEKKKKKKKKATAKVDGEPSDPARKSQRKKKSKKKVAAAGSVDVAPAVDGVPVRKKKTLRRKKKKESLFQRPNVLDPFSQGNLHLVRELLRAGEENVVKSNEGNGGKEEESFSFFLLFCLALLQWRPTLTHRCLEMIVKEPEEAKYRFLYVLLVLDKKTPEEVIGFFEQALHCDETYSPARDSFAYFLECNGHKEVLKKKKKRKRKRLFENSSSFLFCFSASLANL